MQAEIEDCASFILSHADELEAYYQNILNTLEHEIDDIRVQYPNEDVKVLRDMCYDERYAHEMYMDFINSTLKMFVVKVYSYVDSILGQLISELGLNDKLIKTRLPKVVKYCRALQDNCYLEKGFLYKYWTSFNYFHNLRNSIVHGNIKSSSIYNLNWTDIKNNLYSAKELLTYVEKETRPYREGKLKI